MYKDRSMAVGIICTKNFLDKNLVVFDMFHMYSFLYRINPLTKKNSGIRNSSRKLEYGNIGIV